jgi:hypothetical protein
MSQQQANRTAVIVVHGLGNPAPGETVRELTNSLSREPGFTVDEQLQLPAKGGSRHAATVCRLADRQDLVFTEVYWGDLSSVGDGPIGFLAALRDVAAFLPHTIRAAVSGEAGLGRLCRLITGLLLGPIAGLNIFLLVAYAIISVMEAWIGSSTKALPSWVMLLTGLLTVTGATLFLSGVSIFERLRRVLRFSKALCISSALIGLTVALLAGFILKQNATRETEDDAFSGLDGVVDRVFRHPAPTRQESNAPWERAPSLESLTPRLVVLNRPAKPKPGSKTSLQDALHGLPWEGVDPLFVVVDLSSSSGLFGRDADALVRASNRSAATGGALFLAGASPDFAKEVQARAGTQPIFCLNVDAARKRLIDDSGPFQPTRSYSWYGGLIVALLQLIWAVLAVVSLLLTLFWIALRFRQEKSRRSCWDGATAMTLLLAGLWILGIPTAWQLLFENTPESLVVNELQPIFRAAVPLIGFQWLLSLLLSLIGAFGAALFFLQRRPRADGRLILHPFVMVGSAIVGIVGPAGTLLYLIPEARGWMAWFTSGNTVAITISLALGTAVLVFQARIRPVVDIVLDVVHHFRQEFRSGRLAYARRISIEQRFQEIVRGVRQQFQADRLVIVAHSQGSVISIDAMNDPNFEVPESCEVTLITMGSPFTHLYQTYFPQSYPNLSESHWQTLRKRVKRWTNLYRDRDYVGTFVSGPSSAWPRNIPIGDGFHTGYWSEQSVLRELEAEL